MIEDRSLSVVVPAFNEERRLPALLALFEHKAVAVLKNAGFELRELIVVNDGSTDGTAELLAAHEGVIPGLRVIQFEKNRGKGAAVAAGMLAALHPFALVTDVDVATPLEEAGKLLAALEPGFDIAIGSRALPASTIAVRQPLHRELMGKTFNRMLRLMTGLPYRDTQCGFKLFRRATTLRLFELQRIEGFAFDAELLVSARRLSITVVEVPVRWSDDSSTTVGLIRAPVAMMRDLLRIAWHARGPRTTRRAAKG
ncbi:MAG TPA: dolichyl-phosphate beta-glucosyltransferase [Gaiellaceae bacterium]|nr:dolichyl-phosphate beta-glucosyltransferase [Gaiellaceae bacterium]